MSPRTVVCTIASVNYLPRVRVLMASVAEHHPDWEQHLLLVDEVASRFDPDAEPFAVTLVADLPVNSPRRLFFRYPQLELATAVKPLFLRSLFERRCCERVVYLDPDVWVLAPLAEVEHALAAGGLLCLTPHVFEPPSDGKQPSAETLRRAGTFNLGFAALARHPALDDFLSWWWAQTEQDCLIDFERGLFLDQRCLDDAPTLFPDVRILEHRGYNVAYWNLAERPVVEDAGTDPSRFRAGPDPLVFFHFSGYDPAEPNRLSRFQDRFTFADVSDAARLFEEYRGAVMDAGGDRFGGLDYAFDRFSDATPVIDLVRALYRSSEQVREDAGDDPFRLGAGYFNAPFDGDDSVRPRISRLLQWMWSQSPELRRGFPDPGGVDRRDLAWWFAHRVASESNLPDAYVQPIRDSLDAPAAPSLRVLAGVARAAEALSPLGRYVSPAITSRVKKLLEPPAR